MVARGHEEPSANTRTLKTFRRRRATRKPVQGDMRNERVDWWSRVDELSRYLPRYSVRSAITGSTRPARRAGNQLASAATAMSTGTTTNTAATFWTVNPTRLAFTM